MDAEHDAAALAVSFLVVQFLRLSVGFSVFCMFLLNLKGVWLVVFLVFGFWLVVEFEGMRSFFCFS